MPPIPASGPSRLLRSAAGRRRPEPLRPARASRGDYGGRHAAVCRAAVSQDQRRLLVEALRRAQEAAFGPGEYVEQESFVRASEIRALAQRAGIVPGVFRARPVLRSRGAGTVPHPRARLRLRRRGLERERRRHRARARRRPAMPVRRSRGSRRSRPERSRWCSCSRRCSLPRQGAAAGSGLPCAPPRGAVRVHARGGRTVERVGARAHARRRHRLAHPARRDARVARRGRSQRSVAGRLERVTLRNGRSAGGRLRRGRGRDRPKIGTGRWRSSSQRTACGANGSRRVALAKWPSSRSASYVRRRVPAPRNAVPKKNSVHETSASSSAWPCECPPRTAHDPLVEGRRVLPIAATPNAKPRSVVGDLQIQHHPAPAVGEGLGTAGDDLSAFGHLREGVRRQDRVDLARELEPAASPCTRVTLFQPCLDATLRLGEHRVGQVDADDAAAGTDRPPG